MQNSCFSNFLLWGRKTWCLGVFVPLPMIRPYICLCKVAFGNNKSLIFNKMTSAFESFSFNMQNFRNRIEKWFTQIVEAYIWLHVDEIMSQFCVKWMLGMCALGTVCLLNQTYEFVHKLTFRICVEDAVDVIAVASILWWRCLMFHSSV